MRVVAGSARGRRLVAPPGCDVRPTTDRTREAVFNALGSLGAVQGARALDLFAGTGALGIEALSRGAGSATFVETRREARDALTENLASTGLAGRAQLSGQEAFGFLASCDDCFDLVLLDPPYVFDRWRELLEAVAGVAEGATVVIESDRQVEAPSGWSVLRTKRYGGTLITIVAVPSNPVEPR